MKHSWQLQKTLEYRIFKGKLVLTSGLGGMGGAQPLAVSMAGGVSICIEIDKSRIKKD